MLEVLKKQLLNINMMPGWAINTGGLRQIGKTTALMQLAEEFVKCNDSPIVTVGACPRIDVYMVVSKQRDVERLSALAKGSGRYTICTDTALEGYLSTHSRSKVVLFDEGCDLEKLKKIRKDSFHKFAFFAGWINEQQFAQYQQLNAQSY